MATDPGVTMLDDAISILPVGTGWTADVALAPHGCPTDATFAVLQRRNTRSGDTKIAFRHPDSSTDRSTYMDISENRHRFELCPIKNGLIDLYREHSGVGEIWYHGYTGSDFVQTLDGNGDPIDYAEGATFGSFVADVGLDADVPIEGTVAIFWIEDRSGSQRRGTCRDPGSADSRTGRADVDNVDTITFACGCTGQAFDRYAETSDLNHYLVGYMKGNQFAKVTTPDISLATTGAWVPDDGGNASEVDLTAVTDPDANVAFIEAYNNSSTAGINNARASGSADARITDVYIGTSSHGLLIVKLDGDQLYDGYINNVVSDSFVMSWGKATAATPAASGSVLLALASGQI